MLYTCYFGLLHLTAYKRLYMLTIYIILLVVIIYYIIEVLLGSSAFLYYCNSCFDTTIASELFICLDLVSHCD